MRSLFLSLAGSVLVMLSAAAETAAPADAEPASSPASGPAPAPAASAPLFPPELGPAAVPPAQIDPNRRLPEAGDPNELSSAVSMAWRDLRDVVLRERAIWQRLRDHPDDEAEQQRANAEFRSVMTAYENVIRMAPKFAEAYAAYGLLLSRTGNREEAARVLLQANSIDPNIPMVKNQLGNYLFEDGRYSDALGYYLAATQLKPDEPLYHYQLGTLLREYRKFFIHDGLYTTSKIDLLLQDAFRRAAQLAPDNWAYIYRYAESFYDVETPDWPAALAEWTKLEEKAKPGVEKQTIRLHAANVLARMGRKDEARQILDSIADPALQDARAEVAAVIDPPPVPSASEPASEAPGQPAAAAPAPDAPRPESSAPSAPDGEGPDAKREIETPGPDR